MTPQLSVIVSSYNTAAYLGAAIDSILGQTFRDFELILIDDASTDDTPQRLATYDDPRLIVLRNEQNQGLTLSLNRGLALARGAYIARMDADDLAIPETRFADQLAIMQQNPALGFLCGDMISIDAAGAFLNQQMPVYGRAATHHELSWLLLRENPVSHITVMMRRDLLAQQAYDPAYNTAEDYELWARLAQQTQLYRSAAVWALRRIVSSSVSRSRLEEQLRLTRRIMQREYTRLLEETIPISALQTLSETYLHELYPQPETQDFLGAARLLMRAHRRFTTTYALTREENTFIRGDMAKVLLRLSRRAAPIDRRASLLILGQLSRLAPRELLSRNGLRHVLGGQAL